MQLFAASEETEEKLKGLYEQIKKEREHSENVHIWSDAEKNFIKQYVIENSGKKIKKDIFKELEEILPGRTFSAIQFLYYDKLKKEMETPSKPEVVEERNIFEEIDQLIGSSEKLGLHEISNAFKTMMKLVEEASKTKMLEQKVEELTKERDLYKEKFEKISEIILSMNIKK
jgi:hypothetical protein